MAWKKGRGKLGFFDPLIGTWQMSDDTPMGRMTCTRRFSRILGGKFVQLDAVWSFQDNKRDDYVELAVFGPAADGEVHFWSYTSDGKRSEGWKSSAGDISDSAICFEADMDAGRARQAYWPSEDGEGVMWAVENRTKKGWNRFVDHSYQRID